MKKYLLLLILFTSVYSIAFSQPYGNEWIKYSQQYWRIIVYRDGVFRIDSATLANAGVPANTNPKRFQIFGRGVQQYIYVKGENDNVFNANDYIEFYGMHNDGWYDSALYLNKADHPNANYSMFNDTAIYYLTINPYSTSNYRMTLETDVGSYPVQTYFNKISRADYVSRYSTGTTDGNDVTDPEYIASEGWFDQWFSKGSTVTKSIPVANIYSSGTADIEFLLVGASNFAGLNPDHHINMNFAGITIDSLFEGYYTCRYKCSVACSALGTSTSSFSFSSVNDLGSSGNPDYNTLSYINVKYAHTLNLEGDSNFVMYVPYLSASAKVKLSLSNFTVTGNDSVRFYDLTNHKRIKVVKNVSNYDVVLPNSAGEKKCYITSEGQIQNITSLEPVNSDVSNFAKFTDYTTSSVLNSNYIIITHKSLWSAAEEYRDYRNSSGSGTYKALLADVDELYDQFCYGIRKDPVAIRNFMYYAQDNFSDVPKDVFLIGKGYRAANADASKCYRKNSGYYSATLIPGFGAPPSDNLFVKRDTSLTPIIPIGRLAAKNSTQVGWYLNKVQEYEQVQSEGPQEWMKNVLHFGGGSTQQQVNALSAYLNNYKNIIEDTLFGGYVRSFFKSSTAPIQINTADSLQQIINNGVSLMTFFGHGAGIGFDYSIDYPSAYSNHERYPFLMALSCLAGDLFNEVETSSEDFILIDEKGTIGYLASITYAYQDALDHYANYFYKNIGQINYNKPVGICIQNTIDTIQKLYPNVFSHKSACLEMTLHGDPAIKINSYDLPDYQITQPDVYFTPSEVTTLDSVFSINIISTNIGKAIDTVFRVSVKREFPDGSEKDTIILVDATLFKDTFSIALPVSVSNGVGVNKFTVWLDSYSEIPEISETNNSVSATLNIKSNDITPVLPYEFAIVPSLTNLTLKASTGDPFALNKTYRFELDTTDAFNSPAKVSQLVVHPGGVISWNPVFPILKDSIVYFWRCSPDSATYGTYTWRESSFQYITGKHGWGQAHFFQFKNDEYQYVKYNKTARRFQFVNDLKSIFAQTGYFINDSYYYWAEEKVAINGYSYPGFIWTCLGMGHGFKIIVLDSISAEPWEVPAIGIPYYVSGAFHCQETSATNVFDFPLSTNVSEMDALAHFLLDSVPENDYVIAMSHRNHFCNEWNLNLINAFRSIGSSIDTINITKPTDGNPYIIIGKKGAVPGSVAELKASTIELQHLSDTIQTRWKQGYIESTIIGPAASWDSLFWRVESIDPNLTDEVKLNVIGIKNDGSTEILIKDLPPLSDSLDMSIHDRIDSSIYPYIKLMAVMKDETFSTPYQMIRWQVTYEPVPETALDPLLYYTFESDTVAEGDSIHFACATHNIGEANMDSLLIHFWVIDANRNVAQSKYVRYETHPVGDTLIGSVSFPTNGLAGLNELWIEVNPNDDQVEQYHFNNIGSHTFYVNSDKINPLLDVTFDGVHIMDGDIVSSKPLIEIRLKDENKFLLLNDISDTSLFKVFIQKPDESQAARIYFTSPSGEEIMRFYPAPSSSDNKCRIEYNAGFPVDGIYKLIVQAKDKSQNNSGYYDYELDFEVINKSTITQVMNWPNPFSTATHFVFTLTGSEIPNYFKIQIMTITGKVVREITLDELGSIHIGRNITPYAWDGKDEYGDQLANGVYLYRVISYINGKTIEKSQTDADKYFKQEFGKMYLMR
ncbi:MAG TPA: C25 family cysteine peptidase [Bacteroidales bacterium]|nr:C25 family cysteine peptidase [Bacteroidales bacterium]HPS16063.1 C25 family cysteine peptidase [Bacteroidales bacterium]